MTQLISLKKSIAQPSSFGNPKPKKGRRFYKLTTQLFTASNKILFPLLMGSYLLFFGLLVYAGTGIEYSQIFASDGTIFSCQIKSFKQNKKT